MFPLVFKSSLDWDLLGEEEPGLGGRRLVPAARPGDRRLELDQRDDLPPRQPRSTSTSWAAGGLHGLVATTRCCPYFKRSEDNERGENEFHGVGGPLAVSDSRSMSPLDRRDARGRRRRPGTTHIDDLNVDGRRASARFQLTQRNGMRCSAADAFLHPARGPAEPRGARPRRSSSGSSSRATAPSASSSSGTASARRSRAEREVIVSAGAYQSPVLLMLSGIGPARGASRLFGIAVRQDLPVGREPRRTTAWSTSTT